MIHALARRPELFQRARENRSLVDRIIDETLRYESPVQCLNRVVTRTVELSGVTLQRDDLARVFFGAANRDPLAFSDPDTFSIDRPPSEHVAFGQGIHYCLGAPLARLRPRSR